MTRRYYTINDNEEWMDMTPTDARVPEVVFYAVETENDDELFELAAAGEGQLLGWVDIVNGRPQLTLPAQDS